MSEARGHLPALCWSIQEPDAFEDFYSRHFEHLIAHFARRTFDPQVALDLTAETFAEAFKARKRFRGSTEREATAWLYKMAHHKLGRLIRRGYAERRAISRLGIEVPSLTDEDILRIEELAELETLRQSVHEAFDELPAGQRSAVALRVIDDLSYPDVARELKISEQTARARVSRGLRTLHQKVDANITPAESPA